MIQRFLNKRLTFGLLIKLAIVYTSALIGLIWLCSLTSCQSLPQQSENRILVADETELISSGEQLTIETVNDQIFNEVLKGLNPERYTYRLVDTKIGLRSLYRISFKRSDTARINHFFNQSRYH